MSVVSPQFPHPPSSPATDHARPRTYMKIVSQRAGQRRNEPVAGLRARPLRRAGEHLGRGSTTARKKIFSNLLHNLYGS